MLAIWIAEGKSRRASARLAAVDGGRDNFTRQATTATPRTPGERRDAVPSESPRGPGSLEDYRDYLRLLARSHMPSGRRGQLDASDAVQLTLLKAHEKQEQFRGTTDVELRAWLRTILARILADATRVNRRRRGDRIRSIEASLDQSSARLEAFLAAEQSAPSEQAMRAEQTVRLASALRQLPDDQRSALELRYLQGLSVADVAERMGRGLESVTGLLYRGMKSLRRLMDETA